MLAHDFKTNLQWHHKKISLKKFHEPEAGLIVLGTMYSNALCNLCV